MEDHSPDGRPWVTIHHKYGDIEGHILGNAEGLQQLKERIDEALQTGVGLTRDLDSDFNSVLLLDKHPRNLKKDGRKGRLPQITCLVIAVVLLVAILAAVGFWPS